MKKIIIALSALALTAATPKANAAELKSNKYVLTNKAMGQGYENLVVNGDIDVILVEGTSNQLTMEGYQNDLENVSLEVVGKTLYVNTKGAKNGKKPLVYIPVTKMKYLDIKGKSNVTTLGYLKTDIEVMIAAECHIDLKSTGKITISEASTYDYQIEKWETAKI